MEAPRFNPIPMTNDEDAPVGWVTGMTLAVSQDRTKLELSGVIRGVEELGWDDARFTTSIPLPEGWTLTKQP